MTITDTPRAEITDEGVQRFLRMLMAHVRLSDLCAELGLDPELGGAIAGLLMTKGMTEDRATVLALIGEEMDQHEAQISEPVSKQTEEYLYARAADSALALETSWKLEQAADEADDG